MLVFRCGVELCKRFGLQANPELSSHFGFEGNEFSPVDLLKHPPAWKTHDLVLKSQVFYTWVSSESLTF